MVGAPGEDGFTGAAYVYMPLNGVGSTAFNKRKLVPPTTGGQAGTSVAMANFPALGAGSDYKVAVGIPFWDPASPSGGVAFYDADPPEGPSRLVGTWRPSEVGAAGFALAPIPSSGEAHLAVGAPIAGVGGKVFLLKVNTHEHEVELDTTLTQAPLSSDDPGENFGFALAGSGDPGRRVLP